MKGNFLKICIGNSKLKITKKTLVEVITSTPSFAINYIEAKKSISLPNLINQKGIKEKEKPEYSSLLTKKEQNQNKALKVNTFSV